MGAPHDLGRRGEALAADALTRAGWTILERNFRRGHREIDLIARRGRTVAFVEVKARAGTGFGHPLAAITAWKRREIEAVARFWIARHGRPGDEYRFDAVSVLFLPDGTPRIECVENAWHA